MASFATPADDDAALPRWLAGFRLTVFVSELAVVVAVSVLSDFALPTPLLAGLATYGALTTIPLRRRTALSPAAVALLLGHDVVLLTALLLASGGVHNPFSALFLVYVALAPLLLPGRLTFALVALSIACFASLFVDAAAFGLSTQPFALDHATQMRIHMRGMWVAFALAATLIGGVVVRLRGSLERHAKALEAARARQAHVDMLGALATLAASATHELGTPLSTIAVVAKELERALPAPQPAHDDAVLIRQEVDRCRGILERLAQQAGALRSGAVERTRVATLLDEATRGFPTVVKDVPRELGDLELVLPSTALAMAVRTLVKNALDASASGAAPVEVRVRRDAQALSFVVADHGAGMSAQVLARAPEPFFSTKAPGHGMGLGLFLAKAIAEQLDGRLVLESTEGQGTTAAIHLPLGTLGSANA